MINGEAQSSITADDGTTITYSVSKEGYVAQSGTYTLDGADYTLQVELAEQMAEADLTGISELYRESEDEPNA